MKTNNEHEVFTINEDKYYSVHDSFEFYDMFTYHKIKTNKRQ